MVIFFFYGYIANHPNHRHMVIIFLLWLCCHSPRTIDSNTIDGFIYFL